MAMHNWSPEVTANELILGKAWKRVTSPSISLCRLQWRSWAGIGGHVQYPRGHADLLANCPAELSHCGWCLFNYDFDASQCLTDSFLE